ncbi:MAG: methylmalonyl Co-A mutase-associated GTPase MeaB [Pseudomonadota bacterium]
MALETLRTGGKRALARTLSRLDRADLSPEDAALLDEAFADPLGIVIGLTGPPGVGKSTLTQALIEQGRAVGKTVAVIAVDPSSPRTGGALLGDRTRLSLDPEDDGLFVRSLAARNRLGGLSDHAIASTVLLRALFDWVIVETVGIGQSDDDITLVADQSVLCVQPGSGDALQFMKAGIMEWPDIICVTKSDTGAMARRAKADVEGALGLAVPSGDNPAVLLVSGRTGEGLEALMQELLARTAPQRERQAARLLRDAVQHRFGVHGLAKTDIEGVLSSAAGPFSAFRDATERLAV